MRTSRPTLIRRRTAWRLALAFGMLLAVWLVSGTALAQEEDSKWDSERCLDCHDGSDQTAVFPSGEELGIGVNGAAFLGSVHAEVGVDCVHCHTDITGFPHPDLTTPDVETFVEGLSTSCSVCHWRQFRTEIDGAHALVSLEERAEAPGCIDCHDPHAPQALAVDHPDTQAVCSECHTDDVAAEVMAIHTFNPTVTEAASPPPLFLFYLMIGGVIIVFVGLVWGLVEVIRRGRRRFASG